MDDGSVILGAVIALVGTAVTNYLTFRSTKLHEEKTSERLLKELDSKRTLEIQTFEHNIIINNREHIPDATRAILIAINTLFECTEKLVLNYPGTAYTGKYPVFSFSSTIDNFTTGFPNSRAELIELSKNWYAANKELNNIVLENSLFLSFDIVNNIEEYNKYCENIRDYFYGRYSGIMNEEEFNLKKDEYEEEVTEFIFIKNEGRAKLTYSVLNQYSIIKKYRSTLATKINNYQKQQTEF